MTKINSNEIKKQILEKLKEIIDPEIGYDIVSLGEIEDVIVHPKEKKVEVIFLPTTPMCPFMDYLIMSIDQKISELGYEVDIQIDLEKQWSFDRVDPEIKKKLGIE